MARLSFRKMACGLRYIQKLMLARTVPCYASQSRRILETLRGRLARLVGNIDYAAELNKMHAQQMPLIDHSMRDLNIFQAYHARFSKISSTTFAVAFTISSCSREWIFSSSSASSSPFHCISSTKIGAPLSTSWIT